MKQNWLGFSKSGNGGAGLAQDFANKFIKSLIGILSNFGEETASESNHLEKFTLIDEGVGRDKISDFTVNLIKRYLLEYTEKFAKEFLDPNQCRIRSVSKVDFDFNKGIWRSAKFYLPIFENDFVILTPKELLTREETWINRKDMLDKAIDIAISTSNSELRFEFGNMLIDEIRNRKHISRPSLSEISSDLISKFPELMDEYIAFKESTGQEARSLNDQEVKSVENTFILSLQPFVEKLLETRFFDIPTLKNKTGANSFQEAMERVEYLKDIIENKDGYRIFFRNGQRIAREDDIQILFRFTWLGSISDINREVNNSRGPADFAASIGAKDKTIVEFKLGSSTLASIKKNILNQIDIYKKAGDAKRGIMVIICFSQTEIMSVSGMIKTLDSQIQNTVVIVDASPDKKSASKASDVKPDSESGAKSLGSDSEDTHESES